MPLARVESGERTMANATLDCVVFVDTVDVPPTVMLARKGPRAVRARMAGLAGPLLGTRRHG